MNDDAAPAPRPGNSAPQGPAHPHRPRGPGMSRVRQPLPPLVVVMVSGPARRPSAGSWPTSWGRVDRRGQPAPPENVAEDGCGHPLGRRRPLALARDRGRTLHEHGERREGLVVACSALKRVYRERIRSQAPSARPAPGRHRGGADPAHRGSQRALHAAALLESNPEPAAARPGGGGGVLNISTSPSRTVRLSRGSAHSWPAQS
ncbi:gluconokinase [Kocuria rhizophila]|nr:gluconokinase [Kocuria rhizophila]